MFGKLFKDRRFFACLFLVALGFILYWANLNNVLFWDDEDWIVSNPVVHGISWERIRFWFTNNTLAGIGLSSNYYRPFLFLTFAVNYILGGINPIGYHLASNGIHLLNGLLIFLLLNKVMVREEGKVSWAAFLTSLIFLIHPLQTEAVAYISGRGDPLVVLFMLLALWFFNKAERRSEPWHGWRKLLSLFLLVLGILSRETGIIFPFVLMVWYIAFIAKSGFWKSVLASLAKATPYFIVVLIYGVLRLTVLNFENTLNFYSKANVYSENIHVRLLTFMHVLWVYFKLLFAPVGLHMDRSMTVHTSLFQWPVWVTFLILVALIALLIYFYRLERKIGSMQGRITDFRAWFFGAGIFFAGLGPVSGITPVNALIYEHWLYLPMAGFFFILSFYLEKVFSFLLGTGKKIFALLTAAAFLVWLGFLGYQTVQRNIIWGKPTEFFEDILKYESGSARILNNLGNISFNEGNLAKAKEYYWRSIEIGDVFPQPHFNIGAILQEEGDLRGAIKEYEKALELDPNFFYPYPNIVAIYASQGDYKKALFYSQGLKRIRPNDPRVYYNMALIYNASGDSKSALAVLKEGMPYAQYDPEIRTMMESLLKSLER